MLAKFLSNKKAAAHIDVIIGVFVVVMVIVITLNVFAFVTMKTQMDRIADTLIETATFAGGFGENFDRKVSELQEKHFKFDIIIDADAWYNEEYKRVQLGDGMSITIVAHSTLSGINIVFPMDLTVYRSGISERYWSPDVIKPGLQNPEDESAENSQIRFALDNKTKKFHEVNCTQLQSIPTGQMSYTSMTYSECVMMGFAACAQCSPHMCTAANDVEFFNKQWHWGLCNCGEVAEIEEHFWVYQESDNTYYCTGCLAAKRNDSVYCRNCAQKVIGNTHANNCAKPTVALVTPSVTLNGNELTITRGDEHTTNYAVYVDDVKKATFEATGNSTTFNLSSLKLVEVGPYVVTVKAETEDAGYASSAASSAVEYKVPIVAAFDDYDISPDSGVVELTWEELKLGKYSVEIGYDASAITDTAIGDNAFAGVSDTFCIYIPEGVTTIGDSAFYGCYLLYVDVPSSVKSIGDYAFHQVQNYGSLTLSEGLETVGDYAFYQVHGNSFTLPSTVKNIGEGAFKESELSGEIVIASGATTIPSHAFYMCLNITSVTLPDTVTSIGASAFGECASLTSINIPEGITTIEDSTFFYAAFTNITIPNSITSIKGSAFGYCQNLNSISFTGTIEEWNAIDKYSDSNGYNDWNVGCGAITVTCTDGTVTIPAGRFT